MEMPTASWRSCTRSSARCPTSPRPFGIQAVQEKCDPWVKAVPPVADLISYPVAAVFNLLVSLEVGKK